MSRLFAAVAGLRTQLGPARRHLLERLLYEAIYSVPAIRRAGFFNNGYDPPEPGMLAVPALAHTPCQAALYDFALRAHPGPMARPPRSVLDIGCGLGGGLLYAAAAFRDARLVGVDQARRAIRGARHRLAAAGVTAELLAARGDRLPLPGASFDLVVSIGTLTYIGYRGFMREAARVMAPGALLSVTGGVTDTPLLWTQARLASLARETGLELRSFRDITAPSFAALERQAEANEALVAALPRFLRAYGREWAVLPGTLRHAMFLDGRKKEFAAVLSQPG